MQTVAPTPAASVVQGPMNMAEAADALAGMLPDEGQEESSEAQLPDEGAAGDEELLDDADASSDETDPEQSEEEGDPEEEDQPQVFTVKVDGKEVDVTLAASVADVLSFNGQERQADDPGADRLVFWDDSAGKLTHLTLGTNLTITGTTLDAAGGSTDLGYTASTRLLTSSTGADVTLPLATTSDPGLMAAADKAKLDGVAAGATANSTDAQLRDRSTHTGTQSASTITGLATVATTGAYADLTGKLRGLVHTASLTR